MSSPPGTPTTGAGLDPLGVAERTREAMGSLTASERKVARALLSMYPVAGLGTVAELAERAGVSSPTVVRFVARLGFEGFAAFQGSLRREVHARMGSPLEQYSERGLRGSGEALLPYVADSFVGSVQASFAEVSPSEFERAVELLASLRLRVHVVGGRFSHVLAEYLVAHLHLLRPGVALVPQDEFTRVALAADASRRDVLVVFDYRRYDEATTMLARQVASAGAQVVLLTDPWLSPVAEVADVVLPVRVESLSPFDSLVPALALVEALVAALTERRGEAGRTRVERFEAVGTLLDPGWPPTDRTARPLDDS